MPLNTVSLKTFAPAMRRQLLEAVGRKLDLLLNSQTPDTLSTYAKQIAELREQEAENRKQLLERVAYTWFNRLCALRYLDARGWHPFGCKVLMPAAEGETQPELLKLMRAGNLPSALQSHTDQDRLHGLLDGQIQTAIAGADPQGEVYRQLVLAVCRCYHELLPNLFEGLDDASELLLPDDLLSDGSIVGAFRKEITDDDCQDVESLGWLYQFYIAEKKDEVMARKKAVPTEDIPAVTQLFTPHWIVRYLVENSLGRLWLLNRPGSKLREQMPYYIEGEAETDFLRINKPEDIKLLDPACGSGHMLTYAFDLLNLIYEEEGYAPSEISDLILQHNLHGLEICPRAAQLAQFALVCKAREQSRAAFRHPVKPQVMCLRDVVLSTDEMKAWSATTGVKLSQDEFAQIHQFRENTKTFGSLIQPVLDGERLATLVAKIAEQAPAGDLLVQNTSRKIRLVIDQAEMLSQRYQVVVANPPYMGGRQLNSDAKRFASSLYPDSKSDLYSMFIERGLSLVLGSGWSAMVTMHSWMFLGSYEELRRKLLTKTSFQALAHLDNMVMGIAFGTSATIWENKYREGRAGHYCYLRLSDLGEDGEPVSFPPENNRLRPSRLANYDAIPGSPIAYWISDAVLNIFRSQPPISERADARAGLQTSDNNRFLRLWHEIQFSKIGFGCSSSDASKESGRKWFPCNKGGGFRKWYGNWEYVVNWENGGAELYEFATSLYGSPTRIIKNADYYFRESVTWSDVTSGKTSFRLAPLGTIFDATGHSAFFGSDIDRFGCLAYLNTKFVQDVVDVLNPTIHFHVGYFRMLPSPEKTLLDHSRIGRLAVPIAHADWDNFELD